MDATGPALTALEHTRGIASRHGSDPPERDPLGGYPRP